MLFPLRVIRRIHREGFRCIPEAIRFRIALHRQRPFLQMETALRQAEEDGYQAFIRRHEAPPFSPLHPDHALVFPYSDLQYAAGAAACAGGFAAASVVWRVGSLFL